MIANPAFEQLLHWQVRVRGASTIAADTASQLASKSYARVQLCQLRPYRTLNSEQKILRKEKVCT